MPDDLRPFLIGFAAESDDLEANARSKLRDKGLDLIVGNTVGGPFDAIGSDDNKVTVLRRRRRRSPTGRCCPSGRSPSGCGT